MANKAENFSIISYIFSLIFTCQDALFLCNFCVCLKVGYNKSPWLENAIHENCNENDENCNHEPHHHEGHHKTKS